MGNVLKLLSEVDPANLGTKAKRLAEIARNGYRIPYSWVISNTFQSEVFALNRVNDALDLRARRDLGLPATLHQDLVELVDSLEPSVQLVARSSCDTEDLPFASAAGKYETFLSLRTVQALEMAIAECYLSMANVDLLIYLDRNGLDAAGQRMAILIQKMIDVDISGVMYTVSPFNESNLLIEYVHGNGCPVVAGTTRPEAVAIAREERAYPQIISDAPNSTFFSRLRSLGLALEDLYGGPQDVEWGMVSDELVVFQSRDIVGKKALPFQPVFERHHPIGAHTVKPLAWHFAVGTLAADPQYPLKQSEVALFGATRSMHALGEFATGSSGVVCTTGGQLSHLASVCRELNLPACVADEADANALVGKVVVVDCESSVIFALADLSTVEKKRLIFDWARLMCTRGVKDVSEENKLEGVVADRALVRHLWERIDKLPGGDHRGFVQRIYPFDFPDRVYCGVSARIQSEPGFCRVQFKCAQPDEGGRYRRDHEVHVLVPSVVEGTQLLSNLGYIARPFQERFLVRTRVAGATVQFNYWPFAKGVYVGIEAADTDVLVGALDELEISEESISALDGVDLFTKFGISLERCRFESRDHEGIYRYFDEVL